MTFPKIVDTSHYHLWTDALHGRALATQAKNRWDRGTYIRWTFVTAWTVLEMACEDALESNGIGRRFKENLNGACANKGIAAIDWGRGVWQQVEALHAARKDFVHINDTQGALFPGIEKADWAIATVRDSTRDIFVSASKPAPSWLHDDDDRGWDSGSEGGARAAAIHAGADPDGADTVRIAYEHKDREYDAALLPPGTDYAPHVENLLLNLRTPVTAVRVYRGKVLVYERTLPMRGT